MTTTCPSCGCHQPEGLLCWQCSEAVLTMWAAVPELVDQLQVAIAKQAKIGGGGKAGKGSAHERLPINLGALAVRDALMVEVRLWAGSIDEVRRHPKAAEIVRDLGRVVKDAYRTIDRMQDRQYLGTCFYEEDGATCHAEVWARPGAHQVTCTQCGITHEVGERRAWLLKQAEDMLVTSREASSFIGELGGIPVTQASIRGFIHRGRLAYRAPADAKRFRLGDLLEVLVGGADRRSA